MVAQEYNDPAGVYKVQTFGTLHLNNISNKDIYLEINNLEGMVNEKNNDLESAFDSYNNSTGIDKESIFDENKSLSKAFMNLGRMELIINGNFSRSLDLFNKSLEIHPANYEAWTNRGVVLFNLGKYEEANNIFDCSFSANGGIKDKDEDYWNKIAEILASKRWYNSSMTSLSDFNKSKLIRTNYNKGLAKVNLGKFEDAYFDEAISDLGLAILNPYDIESNRDRKIVADAWMNKAIANASLHRYDDALEDIANSIEMNRSMSDAWYIKGLILLSLERPHEANLSFSKAFELDNLSLKSRYGFGQSLFKNGQYHAALEIFSQCLIDDNNNEEVWVNKGIVENVLDRKGDSLISFGEALQALKHKRARIWCDIGYAWYWLPKTQSSSAQRLLAQWSVTNQTEAFNKSIIFDPDFSESYYNNSIIMCESGDYDDALKSIETAAKLDPTYKTSSEFYYHRSLIYYNLSKFDDSYLDESYRDLTRSYLRNKFNLKTIYFIKILYYQNNISNESMRKVIEPYRNLHRVSNSDIDIRSTIGDIEFLLNELNRTNQTESRILDYMAHVKYDMSTNCSLGFISNREMVYEALEEYIDSRKLSPTEGIDALFQAILFYANIASFILGLVYIFLIKFYRLKVSKLYILIIVNIIGFTLLSKIFSDYFDISRAFWSQLIQLALFILFIVSLKLTKYLNIKYLMRIENAFEQLNPTYINMYSIGIISILAVISYILDYIHVFSLLTRIQAISILILGYLILITSIPLYNLISYKKESQVRTTEKSHENRTHETHLGIKHRSRHRLALFSTPRAQPENAVHSDGDLRNVYAIVQFFYLTLFAVPLSWFFWLIGIPRDLSVKIPLEDQILYIPPYSLSLLAIFSILLIYPYCIKYILGGNSSLDSTDEPTENKKSLKELDIVPGKVWKGFIACIIGPIITLLLSLIAPMLLVPVDQTSLANMIIAAIAAPNLGV